MALPINPAQGTRGAATDIHVFGDALIHRPPFLARAEQLG